MDIRKVVDELNAIPQYAKDIVVGILENRIDPLIIMEAYQLAVKQIVAEYKDDSDRLKEVIRKAYKQLEKPHEPLPRLLKSKESIERPFNGHETITISQDIPDVVFPVERLEVEGEKG